MRKGYWYIFLFSLFVSVAQALKYRIFIKRDFGEDTLHNLIVQVVILFLVILIPGILAVRWYYKHKDK